MTDKTRLEFEEVFPAPASSEWRQESNHYCWRTMSATHPHDDLWQVWQAAKEKYEPRWISVYENLPEEDTDVLCILEDGEMVVASHHNSFFTNAESIDSGNSLLPVTLWMPAPSTQGGGD